MTIIHNSEATTQHEFSFQGRRGSGQNFLIYSLTVVTLIAHIVRVRGKGLNCCFQKRNHWVHFITFSYGYV